MDAVLRALADQQDELSHLLKSLSDGEWTRPTRCDGWDVADVVLHLAQTDELAAASAGGRLAELNSARGAGPEPAESVDAWAAARVEAERGETPVRLFERWSTAAGRLVGVLGAMDLSTRVAWVAGELSARTLATTRLAEAWIHAGDIADAVGKSLPPTDRLQLVARLAWRTLPYAFATAGRSLSGPVAFRLESPSGEVWSFVPPEPPTTTIRGSAAELCAVAARRLEPSGTSLTGDGPDTAAVLSLVRTYA